MSILTVCRLDEMTDGEIRKIDHGSQTIAVVRSNGRVYALQNRCAHKGAPIGDGTVSERRDEIICPWHRFRFLLKDGRCATNPEMEIRTFAVAVSDGLIRVDIS